jgi:LacI family transcriptional regulator
MTVRMKDIAQSLGVSQTTVSHVLRGRSDEFRIGASTAQRVREAALRFGYQPSALARSLKHHHAYALALAVGDVADPFWSALALGAQQEAERHGYMLVVSHTGEALEKERQLLEMLRQKRVDGLLLAPARLKARHLLPLRREGRPFVLVDRTIDGLDVPSVVTDSVAGLRLAVDHLVAKGHRKIGYVGGPTYITTFRDRLLGFRQALARHRLKAGGYVVTPSDPVTARKAAERLFRRPSAVTAVIAANLWLAIGTLRAAPEDVAIVGFDDFFLADVLRRPITTIAQPVEELGRQAVSLLLEEIARPGGARRVVLPPRLIVRRGGLRRVV